MNTKEARKGTNDYLPLTAIAWYKSSFVCTSACSFLYATLTTAACGWLKPVRLCSYGTCSLVDGMGWSRALSEILLVLGGPGGTNRLFTWALLGCCLLLSGGADCD